MSCDKMYRQENPLSHPLWDSRQYNKISIMLPNLFGMSDIIVLLGSLLFQPAISKRYATATKIYAHCNLVKSFRMYLLDVEAKNSSSNMRMSQRYVEFSKFIKVHLIFSFLSSGVMFKSSESALECFLDPRTLRGRVFSRLGWLRGLFTQVTR